MEWASHTIKFEVVLLDDGCRMEAKLEILRQSPTIGFGEVLIRTTYSLCTTSDRLSCQGWGLGPECI